MREAHNDEDYLENTDNTHANSSSQNLLNAPIINRPFRSASLTCNTNCNTNCNTLKFELELPKQFANHRRPSQLLIGDNELTVKFSDEENMNENDEKMNEELLFSANQSYNDSNNNLYNPNVLRLPTNSMDIHSIDTLTNSQISLNQHQTLPHDASQPQNVPSPVNLSSSPSNQHHPSILLRTPELLNVVQEGEIMQFSLPANQTNNYPQSNQQNFRLSSINTNSSSQPQSTIHHRTSRCKVPLINSQAEYCDCRKNFYRHSMFVGNGLLDYSQNNKQFSNHPHHDEVYEDCSIANTHTIDANTMNTMNMATSTSVDAVNNQWLVNNKQHHVCPSCNHPSNYKKSCVSLSCDKHLYHLHQPGCHNLNQLNRYDSQDHQDNHQQSNIKNKELYLDTASQTKLDREQPRERLTQILGEMIIPFIFAGLGNVATGYMLSNVQHWLVFQNVPQLIILIPALLGLKGNVEMTLASRLSTHANLGHMDKGTDRRKMVIGNMALVQCQASSVGFLAPLIALAISYINPDENDILTRNEIILLMTASVLTANIANLLLSTFMFIVIFICRKAQINPDNVATPIAASLGDFLTMTLLAYVSKILFTCIDKPILQISILSFLLMMIPFYAFIAKRIKFTRKIVFTGFMPICGAMMLQITGGMIMEHALSQFKKLAAFQPVINGVGGNLVSIQCSRMATYLHKNCRKKFLPETDRHWLRSPIDIFFSSKSAHSGMARMLLCLSIPSHLLFLIVIKITRDIFIITTSFLVVYVIAASFQVACLLILAYTITHFLWKKGINPDNWTIPFLTASGDLIGSGLLALAFIILSELKDENAYQVTNLNLLKSNLSSTN